MKKKCLLAIAALTLAVSLSAVSVSAADSVTVGEITYVESEDGVLVAGADVTSYGEIEVPKGCVFEVKQPITADKILVKAGGNLLVTEGGSVNVKKLVLKDKSSVMIFGDSTIEYESLSKTTGATMMLGSAKNVPFGETLYDEIKGADITDDSEWAWCVFECVADSDSWVCGRTSDEGNNADAVEDNSQENTNKVDLMVGDTQYRNVEGECLIKVNSLDEMKDITILLQNGIDVEGLGIAGGWHMSTSFLDDQGRGVLEVMTVDEGKGYKTVNLQTHYADCPGAEVEDIFVANITFYTKDAYRVMVGDSSPLLDGEEDNSFSTVIDLSKKTSKKKPAKIKGFEKADIIAINGDTGIIDVVSVKAIGKAKKATKVAKWGEVYFNNHKKNYTFQLKFVDGYKAYVTFTK